MIGLMAFSYAYLVTGCSQIGVDERLPFVLRAIGNYIASVSYPSIWGMDLGILAVLIGLAVLARRLVMRNHWQDISLGYLGDPLLHEIAGDPLRAQQVDQVLPQVSAKPAPEGP